MGFGECPKCWDYYCGCSIEIYKSPVIPIETVKEVDMNKREMLSRKKPGKVFMSSYGDKVFKTLGELMKYEEEIERKMDESEKQERKIPYKSEE